MHADLRARATLLLAALFLLFATTFGFAQGITTGSISGTVADQQKAVVAGATVSVTNRATNAKFSAVTNSEGYFTMRNLPIGTYDLTVQAANFAKLSVSAVVVNAGSDTALGAQTLRIGNQEVVQVEGGQPLIETSTHAVSQTFDEVAVDRLPIGNGFDALTLFVPGVNTSGNIGSGLVNTNGASPSVNGQRPRSNNFQIDGQGNNDNSITGPSIFLGNQDIIGEFQVITNFSAEYGRNLGGTVNVVTKAGQNQFHGTLFEYWYGNTFASHQHAEKAPQFGNCLPGQAVKTVTPFAPAGCTAVKPIARLVDNRYGGTFGGPILHDKMWFFGSYFGERQRTSGAPSTSGSQITPTPAGLATLLSSFPASQGVKALAAFGPAAVTKGNPTFSGQRNVNITSGGVTVPVEFGVITRNVPSAFNDHEATVRYDWQISSKDRFFTRYIFQQNNNVGGSQGNGFANGDWVDVPGRSQQIGLDYTRNISDKMVNQFRFSFSRAGFGFEGGSYPCARPTILTCPPSVGFQSAQDLIFGRATNLPQGRIINNTQYQDNATYLWGKHTFKMGGEYDRQRSPNVFLPLINGSYTFADFNALVSNTPATFQLALGPPAFNFKEQDGAAYFQDDWRIKDNLTLFLGVRWEFYGQALNYLADLSTATQTGPTPNWQTSLPLSQTTVPRLPQDTNNFGPNVGFAWTPRILPSIFGSNKTTFRGGYRLAYDPSYYNIFLNVATSAPTVNTGSLQTALGQTVPGIPTGNTFTGAVIQQQQGTLLPKGVNPGTRTETTVDPHLRAPYANEWNLGMQREINSHLAAEIRYEGSHSVGELMSVNANPALGPLINPSAFAAGAGVPAGVSFASLIPAGFTPCADTTQPGGIATAQYANCNFRNVTQRGNYGWAMYHGLNTQLRIRAFHGLSGSVGYTWSHNIDNFADAFSRAAAGANSITPNPFDTTHAERGRSALDYPNVATVALLYDTPWFRSQKGIIGHLLGGWEANTTYRFTSGEPWTPLETKTTAGLCDPTNTFSAATDACRPILLNANAPLNTVAQITGITAARQITSLKNINSGATITSGIDLTQFHWLINDNRAAVFMGTPFAGVSRNTQRGDTVNTVNLEMVKSVKLTERMNLRLHAVAFNLMNRDFRGQPGVVVNRATVDPATGLATGSFANTFFGNNGGETNSNFNGTNRRRIEIGAKFTF